MDDKHFISGKYSNPSVFNNPQVSDIVLKCRSERFYAHRAILRLWSPFFARSLNFEFPVAKSAVFEIDECEKPFRALLKHMYGMPFGEHPDNEDYEYQDSCSTIEHCISVYMAADKYDVPSVRLAALASVKSDLICCNPPCTESDDYDDYRCYHTAAWIANICGPKAPQLADGAMRSALFEWVNSNFDLLSQDHNFTVRIQDGSLLDTELNAKLLFALGAKVRRLIKKNEATGVRRWPRSEGGSKLIYWVIGIWQQDEKDFRTRVAEQKGLE
ncbi:hypothetical protein KCU78_g7375, partial [Aureobasidium melanogenum]